MTDCIKLKHQWDSSPTPSHFDTPIQAGEYKMLSYLLINWLLIDKCSQLDKKIYINNPKIMYRSQNFGALTHINNHFYFRISPLWNGLYSVCEVENLNMKNMYNQMIPLLELRDDWYNFCKMLTTDMLQSFTRSVQKQKIWTKSSGQQSVAKAFPCRKSIHTSLFCLAPDVTSWYGQTCSVFLDWTNNLTVTQWHAVDVFCRSTNAHTYE